MSLILFPFRELFAIVKSIWACVVEVVSVAMIFLKVAIVTVIIMAVVGPPLFLAWQSFFPWVAAWELFPIPGFLCFCIAIIHVGSNNGVGVYTPWRGPTLKKGGK